VDNRVEGSEPRGHLAAFEQRRKALRAVRGTHFNRVRVRATLAASVKLGRRFISAADQRRAALEPFDRAGDRDKKRQR
jgi:hypothetical protein